MECPSCKKIIAELATFENLNNENIYCPNCNVHLQLEYDESSDGESEWFWFKLYDS